MAVLRSSRILCLLVVTFSIFVLVGCEDIFGADDDDGNGDGNGNDVPSTITLTDPDGVEIEFSVTEARWDYDSSVFGNTRSIVVGLIIETNESSVAIGLVSDEDPSDAEFPVEVEVFMVFIRIDEGDLEESYNFDNVNVGLTLEPANNPTTVTIDGAISGFTPQTMATSSNDETHSLEFSIANLSIIELEDEYDNYVGNWFNENDLYPARAE